MAQFSDRCCENCIEQRPSVSLEEWRRLMKINPYFFWQQALVNMQGNGKTLPHPWVCDPDMLLHNHPLYYNSGQKCQSVIYESCIYGGSEPGRDEVWDEIFLAERQFANYTNYWPGEHQDCKEIAFKTAYKGGRISLDWRYLHGIGRIVVSDVTEVVIDPAIDITDENGDCVPDLVTLVIDDDPELDLDCLSVFHPHESWGDCANPWRYEIRPICAERNDSDQIVITFPSWLAVSPDRYRGFNQMVLDPTDPTIYSTVYDVKQRTVDTSDAIRVYTIPTACGCEAIDACYVEDEGAACVVEHKPSLIRLTGSTILDECCCPKCIHKICIHYISGACDNESWISRLVAANLGRELCCGGNPQVTYWQADYVGVTEKGAIATPLTDIEMANPFGTKRGQVEIFRQFKSQRLRKAFRLK